MKPSVAQGRERGRRKGARRRVSIGYAAVTCLVLAAASAGCNWIALGYNSSRYRTTKSGESANVVISGTTAYGSLAERGLGIVDLTDLERRRTIPPPAGSESIDDVAVADGLLFALDARRPGHLSVFSLASPTMPVLASPPVPAAVGPFSGVSAGGGKVIVSGGTSPLALYSYDRGGRLSPRLATIDLGRGQPDVLLAPDGKRAFVSTHYGGPRFGLTTLEVGGRSTALARVGAVDLDTYGFTAGGAKPASFPIEAALVGDRVLIAHVRGVAIVSVADAEPPRLLGVFDVGVRAVNVDVAGSTAAVVGSSPRPLLALLDVADPSAPVLKRSVPLPEGSYATSVAVGTTHVVVAAHDRGLLIFRREGWSLRPERKPA